MTTRIFELANANAALVRGATHDYQAPAPPTDRYPRWVPRAAALSRPCRLTIGEPPFNDRDRFEIRSCRSPSNDNRPAAGLGRPWKKRSSLVDDRISSPRFISLNTGGPKLPPVAPDADSDIWYCMTVVDPDVYGPIIVIASKESGTA